MKKLFMCIIVIIMTLMPFNGLVENYMPKEVKVTIEETTTHSMVILDENQELVSIKNMTERMKYLSCVYSYNYGTHIRGVMNDGTIIRGARGLAPLTKFGDYYFGLTPVDINVIIFEECKPLVQNILLNIVGTEEINSMTVIAASIWLENSHGAHIFYDETTRRVYVGNGYVINQNVWFEIWAGDINLNDELEIGFIPSGGYPMPEPDSVPDKPISDDPIPENPIPDEPEPKPNPGIDIDVSTKTEIKVKVNNGGCGTNNVTVNNGNGNNTTNTNTKVNGNNNTTTTVNNTSTTFSLFAITLNENSNNTIVNTGIQVLNIPKIIKDSTPHVPCG